MIPADFRLNEATSIGYPVLLLLLLAALVVGDPFFCQLRAGEKFP